MLPNKGGVISSPLKNHSRNTPQCDATSLIVQPDVLPGRVDMGQAVQPPASSAVVAISSIPPGISTGDTDTDAVNITP